MWFLLCFIALSKSNVFGFRRAAPRICRGGGTGDTDGDASPVDTNYTFPLCQKGDGHEDDPDSIPGRYLRMQKGNRVKAKAALEATMKWRAEHQIDTILSRPHTKFDLCKAILPHCFLGRDPTDHVIFCQRPGFANMNLLHDNIVSTDELLMHYVCVLEFCWNVLEPRPDQTMTSILDMKGVSFGKTRDMLPFIKQFVGMMSSHYPQRAYRTIIINAPTWFGTLFRMISPLLRESTRQKIQILSAGKKQQRVLEECLGTSLPDELIMGEPLSNAHALPMEKQLRDFVSIERMPNLLDSAHLKMTDLVHYF
jgi:CRAL/TRIO domain